MTEREKVIADITSVVVDMQEEVDEWKDYSDSELNHGLTCDCDWWYKALQTLKDALALLKAQEPRVMTLVELGQAEVAYAEDKDKAKVIPVLVNGRRFDRFAMVKAHLGDGNTHVFYPIIYDYGKTWRCWTSRPTDEQREAVKWE